MKYHIIIEESHCFKVVIEADDRETALDKANEIDLSSTELFTKETIEIFIEQTEEDNE